jgi:mRNA-degrading endonuclease toxin of MazEF toxin-antitoxin module
VVARGQIIAVTSGSRIFRALIISSDEANTHDEIAPWGLLVERRAATSDLLTPLSAADPLAGAVVNGAVVMRIDRSAIRENFGYVSNNTMNAVENVLRDFLDLP